MSTEATKGSVGYATATVEDLRQTAFDGFFAEPLPPDIDVQAGRPKREKGPKFPHGDMFDAARLIANASGVLSPEVEAFVRANDASHMAESMGSFDTQFELDCDEEGNLVILGESKIRSHKRAVLAAFAMEEADPGFGFYTRRTLQEHLNAIGDQAMIKQAPVGSARVLFSPCEREAYGRARSLQMQPDRNMGIMQIIWKRAERTPVLRSVSLDRASLPILRQLLVERGIEPAADAKPEDYLAYVFNMHFDSQADLDGFVKEIVTRFDELLQNHDPEIRRAGLKPRQGVVGYDARSVHTTAEAILNTSHGLLALRQKRKLDAQLAEHVNRAKPLSGSLKSLAHACIHTRRSNGAELLSPSEQVKVSSLLTAKEVDLDDEIHAEALKIIMTVHNSAIEESYRMYISGNKSAMDWMLSAGIELSDVRYIMGAGTRAIEEGRASGACGAGATIEGGLPNHHSNPDGYLRAKYGEVHKLKHGFCACCDKWRLLGPCKPGFCGECDGEDDSSPGYIEKRMRQKQLSRAVFALAA